MEQYPLMVFLNQFQLDYYCQVHAMPKCEGLLIQRLKREKDSVDYKMIKKEAVKAFNKDISGCLFQIRENLFISIYRRVRVRLFLNCWPVGWHGMIFVLGDVRSANFIKSIGRQYLN